MENGFFLKNGKFVFDRTESILYFSLQSDNCVKNYKVSKSFNLAPLSLKNRKFCRHMGSEFGYGQNFSVEMSMITFPVNVIK